MDNNFQQNQTFNLGNMNTGIPVQPVQPVQSTQQVQQGSVVNPVVETPSTTIPTQPVQQPIQQTVAQQPIQQTITDTTITTQTVNVVDTNNTIQETVAQSNTVEQEATASTAQQTVNAQPVKIVADNTPVEPITASDMKIRTVDLVKVLSNADKVAMSTETPVSVTIQFVFDYDGLTVKVTDTKCCMLTQKITSVKYTDQNTVSVYIYHIKPLIDKITSEYVNLETILSVDGQTPQIIIRAGKDTFCIPQAYDVNEGSNIVIESQWGTDFTDDRKINFTEFITKVQKATPFMESPSVIQKRACMYFGESIQATDDEVLFTSPNVVQLSDKKFFIEQMAIGKLTSLDFDSEDITVSFSESDGVVNAVCFKTDTMSLIVNAQNYTDFPSDGIDMLIKLELPTVCTVRKDRILDAIDIVNLFTQQLTDKFKCSLEVKSDTNELIITDKSGASKQCIQLNNVQSIESTQFDMTFSKIKDVFKQVTGDTANVIIGKPGDATHFLRVITEDCTMMISM